MANRKNPSPFEYRGRWRAQVTLKNGSRPFKDFDVCADAKQWINEQLTLANTPHEPRLGGPTQATLADALAYYAGVYTVTKGGAKAELDRINHYLEGANKPQFKLVRSVNGVLSAEAVERPKKAPKAFQAHREQRRAVRQAIRSSSGSEVLSVIVSQAVHARRDIHTGSRPGSHRLRARHRLQCRKRSTAPSV